MGNPVLWRLGKKEKGWATPKRMGQLPIYLSSARVIAVSLYSAYTHHGVRMRSTGLLLLLLVSIPCGLGRAQNFDFGTGRVPLVGT